MEHIATKRITILEDREPCEGVPLDEFVDVLERAKDQVPEAYIDDLTLEIDVVGGVDIGDPNEIEIYLEYQRPLTEQEIEQEKAADRKYLEDRAERLRKDLQLVEAQLAKEPQDD